jgi:FtsZ-binding cell division protein ZapB
MTLLQQYIQDLTESCKYLDAQVAAKATEKTPYGIWKIQEAVDGVKFQLACDEVKNSGEDLSAFNTSVSNAQTYIGTL